MFNIQDPHSDLSPESRDRIEGLANKLLESVDEIAETQFEALQSISAVLAYVISEGFATRACADNVLAVVMMATSATIQYAEDEGNTVWSQKVKH